MTISNANVRGKKRETEEERRKERKKGGMRGDVAEGAIHLLPRVFPENCASFSFPLSRSVRKVDIAYDTSVIHFPSWSSGVRVRSHDKR